MKILIVMSFIMSAQAFADGYAKISVKNAEKLNELISDPVRKGVINGEIVDLATIFVGPNETACTVLYFQPVKVGEEFTFYSIDIKHSRSFLSSIFDFKNKVGMPGFSLRCLNTKEKTVSWEEMVPYFKDIINF